MSHFTVLVFGENVEEQMAPFHEFECTGMDDKYVKDVDITDKCVTEGTDKKTGIFCIEDGLSYYGLEDRMIENESDADREDKHKYGYAVVKDGKLIKAIERTNPGRQWDWYKLGGRWTGFFRLKHHNRLEGILGTPGLLTDCGKEGYADSAQKKYIDFNYMRSKAGVRAADLHDKATKLMGESLNSYISWEEIRDVRCKDNTKEARTVHGNQEAVKLMGNSKDFGFFSSPNDFKCSREEYIQSAKNKALSTFAIIKDGKWYQKGEMGWWGMVSDEKDQEKWNKEFSILLDSVPDDTLLSIMDCHI